MTICYCERRWVCLLVLIANSYCLVCLPCSSARDSLPLIRRGGTAQTRSSSTPCFGDCLSNHDNGLMSHTRRRRRSLQVPTPAGISSPTLSPPIDDVSSSPSPPMDDGTDLPLSQFETFDPFSQRPTPSPPLNDSGNTANTATDTSSTTTTSAPTFTTPSPTPALTTISIDASSNPSSVPTLPPPLDSLPTSSPQSQAILADTNSPTPSPPFWNETREDDGIPTPAPLVVDDKDPTTSTVEQYCPSDDMNSTLSSSTTTSSTTSTLSLTLQTTSDAALSIPIQSFGGEDGMSFSSASATATASSSNGNESLSSTASSSHASVTTYSSTESTESTLITGNTYISLSSTVCTFPQHGDLIFYSDGTVVYTPNPTFVGIDAFVLQRQCWHNERDETSTSSSSRSSSSSNKSTTCVVEHITVHVVAAAAAASDDAPSTPRDKNAAGFEPNGESDSSPSSTEQPWIILALLLATLMVVLLGLGICVYCCCQKQHKPDEKVSDTADITPATDAGAAPAAVHIWQRNRSNAARNINAPLDRSVPPPAPLEQSLPRHISQSYQSGQTYSSLSSLDPPATVMADCVHLPCFKDQMRSMNGDETVDVGQHQHPLRASFRTIPTSRGDHPIDPPPSVVLADMGGDKDIVTASPLEKSSSSMPVATVVALSDETEEYDDEDEDENMF